MHSFSSYKKPYVYEEDMAGRLTDSHYAGAELKSATKYELALQLPS